VPTRPRSHCSSEPAIALIRIPRSTRVGATFEKRYSYLNNQRGERGRFEDYLRKSGEVTVNVKI
jgi:hypothetical protein